jgi:HEAT repeat protein/predicted Ser/Thr protein kinase
VDEVVTLPPGARLDAYRVVRVLGEGGMGFVYEAIRDDLGRRAAIKMLRPELATMPQIVMRFLNEAKAVNLINHQNVIEVYDYGDRYGSVYFIMEFLEGETLDDLMRKRQPMQMPLLLHVFRQIGRALAAAHARQIVHRDLKPANVFVVAREENPYFIKLLDFGIAQLRGEGAVQGLTLAGSVMGTPQYMSPEQISGGAVDARTDVWAMGVMLYRAATGHAPFRGEEFAELADRILHHAVTPASEVVALPAPLSQLIGRCLERRVEDRCPSIGAVLDGLERVKYACQLDDDAILTAVLADAGALGERLPRPLDAPTRGSLAGSLPRHQGAGDVHAVLPVSRSRRRSRLGAYAIGTVMIGGLGATAIAMQRSSGAQSEPPGPLTMHVDRDPQLAQALTAGELARARVLAERRLRAAITSGTSEEQRGAIDALELVPVKASAPLLILALRGSPPLRSKAAAALAELGLPESVPPLRDALVDAGKLVKADIAAALYRLGDRDTRAILRRALDERGTRLAAATAMAAVGDDAGRAVLVAIAQGDVGHGEAWRRAVAALARLGDGDARAQLEGELTQPNAMRRIGAAELLAREGDARARDALARAAADPQLARRGGAALALARLGDREALGWVDEGLTSSDAEERKQAIAICGLLGAATATHLSAIAAHATDPDPGVRMTVEAAVLGL